MYRLSHGGTGNLLLGYTVTADEKKTDEVKYTYDKNGNLTGEYVIFENGKECEDKDKPVTQHKYNELNQLISTKRSDLSVNSGNVNKIKVIISVLV